MISINIYIYFILRVQFFIVLSINKVVAYVNIFVAIFYVMHSLEQWFPTGVSQGGPRGAPNYHISIDIWPLLTPRGAAAKKITQ